MAIVSNTNLLAAVKARLDITGSYHDAKLNGYIDDVKYYLIDGGVDENVVNDECAIGVITRGVADLWNYGEGGEFSSFFKQRAVQLALVQVAKRPYDSLSFIKDYLFEISYSNIDYDFAKSYMKQNQPTINGACSSIRNGNWYGRNFDWKFDENVEFLVRTPRSNGRYGSIGFASAINGLTNEFVKSGSESDLYNIVPFMMADGINECGVVANVNVVPADKGVTTGTVPAISTEIEMCSVMLVRYVLDHFASANEAVEYIKNYVSVYVPNSLLQMGYEPHFMIADDTDTYLVEFFGNETVVQRMNAPYMTNFYLSDVNLNADGKVYTPADVGHSASENNVSERGGGLERYNLIVEKYTECESKNGMRDLLNALKYTKSYNRATEPFWFTEFVGIDGLTVDNVAEDFTDVVNRAIKLFDNRIRNGKTWFTGHSAIYDIEHRNVSVIVQEDGEVLQYEL